MTQREERKLARLEDRVILTWEEFLVAWAEHNNPAFSFGQELRGPIGPYWSEHLDAERAMYRHIELCWLSPTDFAIRYPTQ